ncbi:cupin domain-containing protein [Christiangramia fulva]|uniref:Cupin domain-containing protein n=1 Tax=Christiangramia fulva TaxID=2126553 RepID=A0A2R3Z1Y4_9FLAO|nr:cupin domain-containing protein [Christiangramia fulva]AVR44256.1 cupin domain-containing protein [Christiangramia fulva]
MKRKIINPVIKDTATFLQTSEESEGKVSDMEFTLMPGGGTPLHYHKSYAETFTAIDGDLGLKLGKNETKILKPGETHTVQPKSLHSFFNPNGQEIKFNVKIKPGHTGFENSLRILYGLAEDGHTNKKGIPKSIKHTAIVVCMSDMNIPGFLSLIFPVLKRIAIKAKANGEEKKLLNKYCK